MSRSESWDPAWIRWVPQPRLGLPLLLGGLVAVTAATLVFGLPRGLLALVAVPIPFLATRWSRGPSYLALAGVLAATLTLSVLEGGGEARSFIQVTALLLMWEVVHSAGKSGERATAALAEAEARYRLLEETSNVIPFEFDLATMRFTYVGPQAKDILGYPLEAWLGEGFWGNHLHPDDRDTAMAFCEASSARGEDHEFDYRMIDAEGRPVWIHDIVTVVGESGAPTSLRGIMVDVTERKQAEQERRRLEARMVESQKLESLGLVAGGVAHDFNNLLTAVLGNAALVLEELPADHPVRGKIEDLATAAERGSELTSQMLVYAGRAATEMRPGDLSEIAGETARLLASIISKKARLELELEPSLWVQADAGQIHQVVMNLVINASDALQEKEGTVRIRTGTTGLSSNPGAPRLAFLEVIDDGIGMDAQTLRDMFDPFFTTKFRGRGLGLAAVHGIMRSHGGEIIVDSEPGRGSRIRMLFPTCAPPKHTSAPAPTRPSPEVERAEGVSVLVIDDEAQVRSVVRLALEREGYRVLEAVDGVQGIEILREESSIEGVVLDMTMPRLSGAETLKALRADHPSLPVLLISGYAEEPFAALDPTGPSAFLQKPFRPGEIARKLALLLEI